MIVKLIPIFLSFASYIISIYLYIKEPYSSVYSFIFWVISILLLLLYLAYKGRAKINQVFYQKNISLAKFLDGNSLLIIIVILGIIVRFWSITSIPILTGDETRDAGILPQKIISGEIKDYFGFYAAINHGFFVLSSIPNLIVTDPILKVRLFSVIFGVLSIILIYILTKSIFHNKRLALISAIFLSTYHVHIHFSRSEFLNLFDSFYTLVIFISFNLLVKYWRISYVILLAVILGFGLHFYSGLRAIILLSSLTFLIFIIFKCNIKNALVYLAVFSIFFMIALGPLSIVMATRTEEAKALGVSTSVFSENQSLNDNLSKLTINYKDSLLAYVKNPIDFHYNYGGPFIVYPFSIFFLIGIFLIVKRVTSPINFLILSSMLLIPFFNSAILTHINNTHRLLSLVPLIALVTSLGVEKIALIIEKVINKKAAIFLITLFCSYFTIYNVHLYFYKSVWEKTLNINDFRAWEAQKLINQLGNKKTSILFVGNDYMPSYKSIPSLEYLTQKFSMVDIMNNKHLYDFINSKDYTDYIFIILPNNNALIDDRAVTDYFAPTVTFSHKTYYKDIYLFDFVRTKIQ